jgi:hypothetical protein
LVCQNGIWRGRYCIEASFTMKALPEKGRYNLETCLPYIDCVKAFDRVKRGKLFEILQSKIIPNVFLKHVLEIYSANKSKYTQQINRRTYN